MDPGVGENVGIKNPSQQPIQHLQEIHTSKQKAQMAPAVRENVGTDKHFPEPVQNPQEIRKGKRKVQEQEDEKGVRQFKALLANTANEEEFQKRFGKSFESMARATLRKALGTDGEMYRGLKEGLRSSLCVDLRVAVWGPAFIKMVAGDVISFALFKPRPTTSHTREFRGRYLRKDHEQELARLILAIDYDKTPQDFCEICDRVTDDRHHSVHSDDLVELDARVKQAIFLLRSFPELSDMREQRIVLNNYDEFKKCLRFR